MQLKTADFADVPVCRSKRTGLNVTLFLILTHWHHYAKTWRYPQIRMYMTYRTVITEPRLQETCKPTENFAEFEMLF